MPDPSLIRCDECGTMNRVPGEKLRSRLQPVCGKCKAPLDISSQSLTVTDATFAAEVEQSTLPVLVDLWAPWCGPCRMIAPVVDDLAKEMSDRIRVAKLNIDENPATTQRFNVQSIPMLLVMKGGREIDRIIGAQPKAEIVRRLERAIA